MNLSKIISPKVILATAFTVMAVVAFNLGRPGLHNDLLTSFNEWYQGAVEKLSPTADLKDADLSLKVSIVVKDPSQGSTPMAWELPARSLLDPDDRENTSRVLQLLRESSIFGLTPVRDIAAAPSVLSVSVKDQQKQFEIAIPLEAVQENIQLRNLLKLLEVFAQSPRSSDVAPERL